MRSQLQLTHFLTYLFVLFFPLIFPIRACVHIICYIDLFSVQGATLSQKKNICEPKILTKKRCDVNFFSVKADVLFSSILMSGGP